MADTAVLLRDAIAAHQRGDLATAERGYRAILKRTAQHPDALHLLGVLLESRGASVEGIALIQTALRHNPDLAEAHYNLGHIFACTHRLPETEAHFRRATELQADNALAWNNLGSALLRLQRYDEAAPCFLRALELQPNLVEALSNLATVHEFRGQPYETLRLYEQILALHPENANTHYHKALVLLGRGRLTEGWEELSWRLRRPETKHFFGLFALPYWKGEPLKGKRLLIWTEQGPGEEILIASMLPEVIAHARHVIVLCSPRMVPLFERSFPQISVIANEKKVLARVELQDLDYQASLADLGSILRPSLSTFPKLRSFLKTNPALTAELRKRYLGAQPTNRLVGISWRSKNPDLETEKSIVLAQWAEILRQPGITYVNLQYGECTAELAEVERALGCHILVDPRVDPLRDMDAFAAQVDAMDLVITVSNTTAHVAGALGRPVWTLTAATRARLWYWFTDREDSPWYPSLRLFRQTTGGSWDPVLSRVAAELAKWCTGAPEQPNTTVAARDMTPNDAYTAALTAWSGGDHAETRRLCELVLSIHPDIPDARKLLAAAEYKSGNLAAALRHFLKVLAALPGDVETARNVATIYRDMGQLRQAAQYFGKLATVVADNSAMLLESARLETKLRRFDAAIETYGRARTVHADKDLVDTEIADALLAKGDVLKAAVAYQKVIERNPSYTPALINLALAHDMQGRFAEAFARLEDAVRIDPSNVDAHFHHSLGLLTRERLTEGWTEYAWRFKRKQTTTLHTRFNTPYWAGEDLKGQRLLVWTEQGPGDEILTTSMVPDVLERGCRLVLVCSRRAAPLFRRSFPDVEVLVREELPPVGNAVHANYQASLSHLGQFLRPNLAAFPTRPHLVAHPERTAELRARYLAGGGKRLVGVAWRSVNASAENEKSIGLEQWVDVLKIPNVRFVSLQYGDHADEVERARKATGADILRDPTINPLVDLDTFAAQVAAMDLVISVSNTTVHVAGAIGRPVWTLVPAGKGRIWYWFLERVTSPWYPTMRLFREDLGASWSPTLRAVADNLERWS